MWRGGDSSVRHNSYLSVGPSNYSLSFPSSLRNYIDWNHIGFTTQQRNHHTRTVLPRRTHTEKQHQRCPAKVTNTFTCQDCIHLLAVNFDLVTNTCVVSFLEDTAVLECARQLRKMGDLLDWKYKLLDILIRNYNQAAKIKWDWMAPIEVQLIW